MPIPFEPENRAVLCFDADHRVLFISNLAEEWVFSLFNCKPELHQVLPDAVRRAVPIIKKPSTAASEVQTPRLPLLFKQKDGSSIWMRLTTDHENSHYCLIFERERNLIDPEQLKALGLSTRETEVTFWILHHKTNWEIGKILEISTRTVDKHVEKIFSKLEVNNRSQLNEEVRKRCDNY